MIKKTLITSVLSIGILAAMGSSVFAANSHANQLASQYRIVPDGGIPTPTENGLFLGHYCAPETSFDYEDHIVFGLRMVPKKENTNLADLSNLDLKVEIYTANGQQLVREIPFRSEGGRYRAALDQEGLPEGDYKFKYVATLDNNDVLRWQPEDHTFTLVANIDRPPLPEH